MGIVVPPGRAKWIGATQDCISDFSQPQTHQKDEKGKRKKKGTGATGTRELRQSRNALCSASFVIMVPWCHAALAV